MSNRDELAMIIAERYHAAAPRPTVLDGVIAEAILDAGYRKLVIDESTIERAAKALHDLGATAKQWDERDEEVQELYREDVRAVIAVLNGGAS